MQDINSPCKDCRCSTTPEPISVGAWEWYMVTPEVWAEARGATGFLCIGCLETRLGRQLTGADFARLGVNTPGIHMTNRLLERLSTV